MTTKYAIFVTMQLKEGMGVEFRPHILRNAEAARREESENHQFSVLVAEDDTDRYHFYEVYSTKDALEAHRETPHFKAYVAATKDMVVERHVSGLFLVG